MPNTYKEIFDEYQKNIKEIISDNKITNKSPKLEECSLAFLKKYNKALKEEKNVSGLRAKINWDKALFSEDPKKYVEDRSGGKLSTKLENLLDKYSNFKGKNIDGIIKKINDIVSVIKVDTAEEAKNSSEQLINKIVELNGCNKEGKSMILNDLVDDAKHIKKNYVDQICFLYKELAKAEKKEAEEEKNKRKGNIDEYKKMLCEKVLEFKVEIPKKIESTSKKLKKEIDKEYKNTEAAKKRKKAEKEAPALAAIQVAKKDPNKKNIVKVLNKDKNKNKDVKSSIKNLLDTLKNLDF